MAKKRICVTIVVIGCVDAARSTAAVDTVERTLSIERAHNKC